MALDPDFLADCPYDPNGILFDEILEIDTEKSLVRVRMPTHADLPLTRTQRVDPVRHPCHVNGGLMVHMTGMLGFAHAYYILGLRFKQGWVGYGGVIHKARYPNLALIGEPLELCGWATRVSKSESKKAVSYEFEFTQQAKVVYESKQTAIWMRVDDEAED